MTQAYRQLVLCPQDSFWQGASQDELEHLLRETGLIGAALEADPTLTISHRHYLVGDHFLQHINFMGCAPAVEFFPEQGKPVDRQRITFIHTSPATATPQWYAELTLARPRCPQCAKRFAGAADGLDTTTGQLTCPHCQMRSAVSEFDWKEYGGSSCIHLSIANAYPKETLPSSSLLQQLEQRTGTPWRYFYYNGELVH